MRKLISIILILVAVALGYLGFNEINENTADIEIGDLEISAGDKSGKTTGYVYLGLAAVSLIVGGTMLGRRSR